MDERAYHLRLLDEVFDFYDCRLTYLNIFEDLREQTLDLSQRFVELHDRAMMELMMKDGDRPDMTAILDIADEIMYWVRLKSGQDGKNVSHH